MVDLLVSAAFLMAWVVFIGLYIYCYYQGRKDLKRAIKSLEEIIKEEK